MKTGEKFLLAGVAVSMGAVLGALAFGTWWGAVAGLLAEAIPAACVLLD